MKTFVFLILYGTLVGMGYEIVRAEKQVSYLAGRASVFVEMNNALDENCYAKNGVCK